MLIQKILWPQERVDHIARHQITPEEFEEVCYGRNFIVQANSEGENPVYYVYGQTVVGRYLLCILIRFPDDNGYPVTAREMNQAERKRYKKRK